MNAPTNPVPARPAASTLILRDAAQGLQVLMVRRSLQASFMPGSYVFPGGAVDAADASASHQALCDETHATLAQRIGAVTQVGEQALGFAVAALRECFEECGLWLGASAAAHSLAALRARLHAGESFATLAADAALPLPTSLLQPWSHWVTPAGLPKRFDTLFFIAPAPVDQAPSVDTGETTALAWVQAKAALQARSRGEFALEFATQHILQSLLPFNSVAAAMGHAAGLRWLPLIEPVMQRDAQGRIVGVELPAIPDPLRFS
jgi:8-oxo-dGTP pyrophosphatase MutT (NUDIX family)